MFYIKIDADGKPVNHPMRGDNLKDILEVSYIDEDTLKKHGYAKFEFTPMPANGVSNPLPEYYVDVDGIVRNKINFREFTQDELIDKFIRARRSYFLAHSDWTQAVDSPLSAEKKAEWAAYRQALRDLPSIYPDVQQESDVEWPVPPSAA
jgi:hypothetical protein